MATYYVRPDGNNANAGTADSAAGAWQTIAYGIRNANNGVIVSGDIIYIVGDQGNYTENGLIPDTAGTIIIGLRGPAVIDGTGGSAGSDVWANTSVLAHVRNLVVQNAVDRGMDGAVNGGTTLNRIRALSCGGNGIMVTGTADGTVSGLSARSNGGIGVAANRRVSLDLSEAGDNTSNGFGAGSITCSGFSKCVAYDNGGVGITSAGAGGRTDYIGNTIEGNTGDGIVLSAVGALLAGSVFLNNVLTSNGGYGINSSAGAQTNINTCVVDYNLFNGNTTAARNNFPTGDNDLTSAPGYVNAAGDDLTPDTGSALIGAGYSPFKSPMAVNLGAVAHGEAAAAAGGGGGGPRGIFNGGF